MEDIVFDFPPYGNIIIKQKSIVIPPEYIKSFVERLSEELAEMFNDLKYKISIIGTYNPDEEYPSFYFEYQPESDKLKTLRNKAGSADYSLWTWPWGSAGTYWLEDEPEKDYI